MMAMGTVLVHGVSATTPYAFMVAEHGNVPDGRSCSRLLTSSDVKKDGLMMNKFDMPSAHMSKKSKAAPGVKALKRRLGKARERRRRRRRRLTIWRCTR